MSLLVDFKALNLVQINHKLHQMDGVLHLKNSVNKDKNVIIEGNNLKAVLTITHQEIIHSTKQLSLFNNRGMSLTIPMKRQIMNELLSPNYDGELTLYGRYMITVRRCCVLLCEGIGPTDLISESSTINHGPGYMYKLIPFWRTMFVGPKRIVETFGINVSGSTKILFVAKGILTVFICKKPNSIIKDMMLVHPREKCTLRWRHYNYWSHDYNEFERIHVGCGEYLIIAGDKYYEIIASGMLLY